MQIAGRWIVLTTLAVGLAMSGGAWWYNLQLSRRAAKFWGRDDAALLVGSATVTLHTLGTPVGTGGGRTIAGRAVAGSHELSKAPGLVHLRHTFTQDANLDLDHVGHEAAARDDWQFALEFVSGERRLVVLLSDAFDRLGRLDAGQTNVEVVPCPRLSPVVRSYLVAVGALPAAAETPASTDAAPAR